MRQRIKLVLVFVLLVALALPGSALAKGLSEDKIVLGDTFTLESGEMLDGNLLIIGGAVTLEKDSRVNGDVLLIGGALDAAGAIDGNVLGIGGAITLGESASIAGDLTTMAASLQQSEGARVAGDVITGLQGPFHFSLPGFITTPDMSNVTVNFFPLWDWVWFFFRTFLWAALAVLVAMFLPRPIQNSAKAALEQPILSGGVGLLTTVVVPLLLVGIGITIILIPISLAGFLALALAWFLGRVALGVEVGRRIAPLFKQDWALPVCAGVGTFTLTFVVDAVAKIIPCIGWLFAVLVGVLGLGAVALTRFGTQPYISGNGYDATPPLRPIESPSTAETPPAQSSEEPPPAI